MPAQGVGDNQRVGDQIYLSGFQLQLLCGQKYDRPNVTWKWAIIAVPKGQSVGTYANIFLSNTGNPMLDAWNTDFVKVLKQGYWKPQQSTFFSANATPDTTREYTFVKKIWLPYKKLVKMTTDAGTTTNDGRDVHLILVPYDAYGTMSSDNIAYNQLGVVTYFRDP